MLAYHHIVRAANPVFFTCIILQSSILSAEPVKEHFLNICQKFVASNATSKKRIKSCSCLANAVTSSNNGYTFYNSDDCVEGRLDILQNGKVFLVDFYSSKLAQIFDKDIHYNDNIADEHRKFREKSNRPNDLEFTSGETLPNADLNKCGGRPCIAFGGNRQGIVFYLVSELKIQ